MPDDINTGDEEITADSLATTLAALDKEVEELIAEAEESPSDSDAPTGEEGV